MKRLQLYPRKSQKRQLLLRATGRNFTISESEELVLWLETCHPIPRWQSSTPTDRTFLLQTVPPSLPLVGMLQGATGVMNSCVLEQCGVGGER